MVVKKKDTLTTDEKLDQIVEYLHRMDRRDRTRMWGSFLKGIIGIIPGLAFIYAAWYFYHHGDQVMADIAKVAAEQAAEVTKMGTESMLNNFMQFQVK